MHVSRRRFVQSAAVFSMGAWSLSALAGVSRVNRKPLRILILGGTGFLGPAVVQSAKQRGHTLTLFNRGRTEKRIGMIDGVEKLHGNRDPKLRAEDSDPTSPMGLAELEEAIKGGATWDGVVDTSGYVPRIVKASAELLAPAAKTYVYISSISAYAENTTPDLDETAAIATMPDPSVEEMGDQMQNYGPLKALCEQAASAAFPGRACNIRPGFIVGPGDPTDRFTYWVVRAARGGEILAPGAATDPVQHIDVRDLADFIVTCIERQIHGEFNAVGAAAPWGGVLDACRGAAGAESSLTWVPTSFVVEQGLSPGGDLPIWVPGEGESAGFHRRSNARAVAAGLTTRPVLETCKATLEWWPKEIERRTRVTREMKEAAAKAGRPEPRMPDPSLPRAGLTPQRESEVLAAWHARRGQQPAGEAAPATGGG